MDSPLVRCADCRFNPGAGRLCPTGGRHATGAPKRCAYHLGPGLWWRELEKRPEVQEIAFMGRRVAVRYYPGTPFEVMQETGRLVSLVS